MESRKYEWSDNPTISGVSKCDTDVLNDCLMHLKYNKGDSLPLFTAMTFDHVLTGDEAKGWALQGSLITMTYPDAVNKIIEENASGEKFNNFRPFDVPTLTSNGTPGGNSFAVSASTTHGTSTNSAVYSIFNKKCNWFAADGNKTGNIVFYNPLPLKLSQIQLENTSQTSNRNSVSGNIQASNDNSNWSAVLGSFSFAEPYYDKTVNIEIEDNQAYKYWRINITSCSGSANTPGLSKITITGDEVFQDISYTQAQNGHKIVDIEDKASVDDLYASTGVADFYVLDSVNQQFYLPRNDWFVQSTSDPKKLNQFNEAGLPNITSKIGIGTGIDLTSTGAFFSTNEYRRDGIGSTQGPAILNFDASRSSNIYGKSSTVQPPASLKLVYYKVGNTVVNESLIDVGQVLSELNLKADIDLSNCTKPYVTETYRNGSSWYRVWSDGWLEQGGIFNNTTSTTITFPQAFKNSNYTCSAIPKAVSGWYAVSVSEMAPTYMKVDRYNVALYNPIIWTAQGY